MRISLLSLQIPVLEKHIIKRKCLYLNCNLYFHWLSQKWCTFPYEGTEVEVNMIVSYELNHDQYINKPLLLQNTNVAGSNKSSKRCWAVGTVGNPYQISQIFPPLTNYLSNMFEVKWLAFLKPLFALFVCFVCPELILDRRSIECNLTTRRPGYYNQDPQLLERARA